MIRVSAVYSGLICSGISGSVWAGLFTNQQLFVFLILHGNTDYCVFLRKIRNKMYAGIY